MLTIKIEENYKAALEEMGVEVCEGMHVMAMRDGDLLMGVGTMRILDGFASFDNIYIKEEFNNFDLAYGLGKSMLNFLDLRGVRNVASNNEDARLLTALRFKPIAESENFDDFSPNWSYCLNLDGYFTSNC